MNYCRQYTLLKELERRMEQPTAAERHQLEWARGHGDAGRLRRLLWHSGRMAVRVGERLHPWGAEDSKGRLTA